METSDFRSQKLRVIGTGIHLLPKQPPTIIVNNNNKDLVNYANESDPSAGSGRNFTFGEMLSLTCVSDYSVPAPRIKWHYLNEDDDEGKIPYALIWNDLVTHNIEVNPYNGLERSKLGMMAELSGQIAFVCTTTFEHEVEIIEKKIVPVSRSACIF